MTLSGTPIEMVPKKAQPKVRNRAREGFFGASRVSGNAPLRIIIALVCFDFFTFAGANKTQDIPAIFPPSAKLLST